MLHSMIGHAHSNATTPCSTAPTFTRETAYARCSTNDARIPFSPIAVHQPNTPNNSPTSDQHAPGHPAVTPLSQLSHRLNVIRNDTLIKSPQNLRNHRNALHHVATHRPRTKHLRVEPTPTRVMSRHTYPETRPLRRPVPSSFLLRSPTPLHRWVRPHFRMEFVRNPPTYPR